MSLPFDLRDLFVTLSNDVGCRAALGSNYSGGEQGEKFKHLLGEFLELLGSFTFHDFIPVLGWLDRLSGMEGRVKRVAKGLDEFLEGLIEERMAALEKERAHGGVNLAKDREDFVDTLLKIQKDYEGTDMSLSRDSIKAALLDACSGGSDTTSAFLEWAMAELLRNPNSMKKLQDEVREVLNGKLDEDDLEKMVFLKAVIKETFRLHAPFQFQSRTTKEDTKLIGYDIATGTMILINSWGISNDPKLWDEPHEFRPERFLYSSSDFRGHNFEFIPFGAGRRQCPGISFANAIIKNVLANLMYKFNWEFPGEDMDMTECPRCVVNRKRIPLQAIATPSSY